MALNDQAHVEAVAIIRQFVQAAEFGIADTEAMRAGRQWLKENHPRPEVYVAALSAASPGSQAPSPAPSRNEA